LAVDQYRWSPNSRWIAVEGVERATNRVGLSVYDLTRGHLRRVSITDAFGSYGLSWCPDSKYLAFTKPSEVDEEESVLAADLWIAPTSSWLPCPIRATTDEIESQPEWLSDSELLVKAVPITAPHTVGRELVLELRREIRRSP
jgi:Tol biopolymer transport system component